MNKTDLFTYGRNCGEKVGSILVAIGVFNDGGAWFKTMPCGSLTTNQAELKAIELALAIVNPEVEDNTIVLHVNNRYAMTMLDRDEDGWLKSPRRNKALVAKVRELYLASGSPEVKMAEKDNKHNLFAKQMMEEAIDGKFTSSS